jgi:hypothetical protein
MCCEVRNVDDAGGGDDDDDDDDNNTSPCCILSLGDSWRLNFICRRLGTLPVSSL